MKAVIIDDERYARKTLSGFISKYCADIAETVEADGVNAGIQLIRSTKPDIVFLDIKMKDGTGFDVLDKVGDMVSGVVFTTAYDEYAVKAFKYNAIDYLLKPIDPDELIHTVQRIKQNKMQHAQLHHKVAQVKESLLAQTMGRIPLPITEGHLFVDIQELLYATADGPYCKITTKSKGDILICKPLSYIEHLLPTHFCRIHKSYAVNRSYIELYSKKDGGYVRMADGKIIPVSRSKKVEFANFL